MKKNLVLFILFLFQTNFAQQQISVTYEVKLFDEKELFQKNAGMRNYFEKAIENASSMKFKLKCNDTLSHFYFEENLSNGNSNLSLSAYLPFFNYQGESYSQNDTTYSKSSVLKKDELLIINKKENWVLHNETKLIANFLCYKATNIQNINNGLKKFAYPVTAWYCPELPYKYGPNKFNNLPGLILELQVRNYVYGANEIVFNDKSPLLFNRKEFKTVTEIELNERITKQLEKE